jgi:hypothetical protein
MKKIPTIFERDRDGDRSRVVNVINSKCQWVFDGEGVATRKVDGTCCRVLGAARNQAAASIRSLKSKGQKP